MSHQSRNAAAPPKCLDRASLARIAAAAGVDPRTAARVIAGERTTSTTRARVLDVLRRQDLLHLAQGEATSVLP